MSKTKPEIIAKNQEEIEIMTEGGGKLAEIKVQLKALVKEGVSAFEIEKLADKLIKDARGKPSFKMVPGYSWATCVNVNGGVVHGIPHKKVVFEKGDVVSIDVGIFYKGLHTDTSITVAIDPNLKTQRFLETGEKALGRAIDKARIGNRIFDLSNTIQDTVESDGYYPIRALVGHGIGKTLHEEPQITCFVQGKKEDSPVIPEGATFAIEVMYTQGSPDIKLSDDGWTITTHDGKISALFEETVAVTSHGPLVLTEPGG